MKIADLIGTHPIGPTPAGCPPGRQCLPPNGYRVPEFTSGSLSTDHFGRLYFAWSDFRNGGAPCTAPSPAAATPPCHNDVFFASSTNGGLTWSGPINIAPAARFGPAAPMAALERGFRRRREPPRRVLRSLLRCLRVYRLQRHNARPNQEPRLAPPPVPLPADNHFFDAQSHSSEQPGSRVSPNVAEGERNGRTTPAWLRF